MMCSGKERRSGMDGRFRGWSVAGVILCILWVLAFCGTAFANPLVTSVGVRGNERIVSGYIMGVVETKPGDPLERNRLQSDIDAIYGLGFFSFVDVDLTAAPGGVAVVYSIMENPIVEEIVFTGNTVYSSEVLMREVFTQVGSVFNRVFFRNDLDRIQERYRKDGYVMVRVADVNIHGGRIRVDIVEPRVGNVIIQGNRKTRTHVIRREIKLERGDIFNVNRFRHELGNLQAKGYFEDVNVGFDVSDDAPDVLDLILTVKEKKTQAIGINVGYGTESGISGGLTYSDTNFGGLGYNLDVGFDEGQEASYWATFSNPYMDRRTFAWRVGVNYRNFVDQYHYFEDRKHFEYDENSLSVFAGFGRKLGRAENWSWFFTLNWRDVKYSDPKNFPDPLPANSQAAVDDLKDWGGKNFAGELVFTLDKRDPYLQYQRGLVWDIATEQAVKLLGGEYSYFKYWTQARYYMPIHRFLDGVVDTGNLWTDDNPIIFASRVRVGSASGGDLPAFARYSLGGMNTLRGYHSRRFEGSNVLLGNFELRVPIQRNFEIVGFYDAGNASNSMNWGTLHDNYGVGLRVRTPMGMLRLDHATGGDDGGRTYFGFGQMF